MHDPFERADPVSAELDALLARFRRLIRSVGARYRLTADDLDEVLQELRIRLWHALPSCEALRSVGASYVYRAASSIAVDIARRERAAHPLGHAAAASVVENVRSSGGGAEAQLEADERIAEIYRDVDRLAQSRRAAVRLYLRGYRREEIASRMGWTEARTRNLLYRALAELRMRLVAHGITSAGAR